MPDLDLYLGRVGYAGPREPTLGVLNAVHQAHLRAIPYENLDIHLGRALTLEPERIFRKLVTERRGGWCFEMNGLLAWALGELGFGVTRLSSSVGRKDFDAPESPSHLTLLVEVGGRRWLADAGFGDAFLEPIPLEEGTHLRAGLPFRLEQVHTAGGVRWVMHNHPHGGAPHYDFSLEPRETGYFAQECHWLQTSPESGFVRTTVCQRFTPGGIVTLRGAVLKTVTAEGVAERTVESEREYRAALNDLFGLDVDTARLWPRVWSRHQEWVKSRGVA